MHSKGKQGNIFEIIQLLSILTRLTVSVTNCVSIVIHNIKKERCEKKNVSWKKPSIGYISQVELKDIMCPNCCC